MAEHGLSAEARIRTLLHLLEVTRRAVEFERNHMAGYDAARFRELSSYLARIDVELKFGTGETEDDLYG